MNALSLVLAALAAAPGSAPAPERDSASTGNPKAHEISPPVVAAGPDPVYPADFYKPLQPQTALDMLERTPGFLLTEGSSVRGFGGAAGNVLIDGQRPTVKGGGITEVLRRIAAARVDRVVLLRGSDAAEAQGQTLVANVILRTDAKGSGNASLTLRHTGDGRIAPSGRISHARSIAGWQTNIELSGEVVRYPTNSRYQNRNADGDLTSTRKESISARAPEYNLALSTSGSVGGGTLTVNLRLNDNTYTSNTAVDVFNGANVGAPDARRSIAYSEKGKNGELGADWTRRMGAGWTAKLIGLGRLERYSSSEDYIEGDYRGLSELTQKPVEFVGRTTVTREGDHPVRPELGFEVAYNRLASLLDYAEDTGGGLIPIALTNANTRVAELRGEAFANVTMRLHRRIGLEAGTALELSRIRVSGETPSEQSLSYIKPSAALVWSPSDKTQLRLATRRTVDQLDFGDFAASVSQADGRPIGGNSGLRPARVTRALARLDHRWGKGGALALEAYHQWHQGLLGYLVLDSGDQALGTIGNGRQWGLTAQATLPLEVLLRNARFTLDGTWRGSRLRDRLTHAVRRMDDISPLSLTAELRHDVPALRSSWGVNYTAAESGDIYYTGEVLHWRDTPTWGAYLETTALPGIKTTLTGKAIFGANSDRSRSFYQPTRAGFYSGSEARRREEGAAVSLTMAKTF